MSRLFFLAGFLLFTSFGIGQELKCQVVINAEQTGRSNITVFKTLENSLSEFINQTKWTKRNFLPHERINCSMFINITEYEGDSFSGTIQVQSSRPVFGSTLVSPVFNFKDNQLGFTYSEYAPFSFNPNEYESNLTSIITFYVHMILGLDADTFEEQGGSRYFETANQIANIAQQGGRAGWKAMDGNSSRFKLVSELLSNSYTGYRNAFYKYHRDGLDRMHMSPEEGKKAIAGAILDMNRLNDRRPNSLLVRTFFDAKADEIEQIFSGGPSVPIKEVVDALQSMAPTFSEKWSNIRY